MKYNKLILWAGASLWLQFIDYICHKYSKHAESYEQILGKFPKSLKHSDFGRSSQWTPDNLFSLFMKYKAWKKILSDTAKENEILLPTEIYFFIFNKAKEERWFSIAFKSLY